MITPFSTEQMIDMINDELAQIEYRSKVVSFEANQGETNGTATTNRGGKLFVQFYQPHQSSLAVRAIHQILRKGARFTFLMNGQGGTNLRTIVLNGEQGDLKYSTVDQYVEFLKSRTSPTATPEIVKQYVESQLIGMERFNPNF